MNSSVPNELSSICPPHARFSRLGRDARYPDRHADFLAAWEPAALQKIIDTCNAGNNGNGMDSCAGIPTNDVKDCAIDNPSPEPIGPILANLPGNNKWVDFKGAGAGSGIADPTNVDSNPKPSATSAKPADKPADTPKPPPPPPAVSPSKVEVAAPVVNNPAVVNNPPVTTQAPAAAAVVPSVSISTDQAGNTRLVTVWETVTETTTVYVDFPEATPAAKPKRSVHAARHAHGHRHAHL